MLSNYEVSAGCELSKACFFGIAYTHSTWWLRCTRRCLSHGFIATWNCNKSTVQHRVLSWNAAYFAVKSLETCRSFRLAMLDIWPSESLLKMKQIDIGWHGALLDARRQHGNTVSGGHSSKVTFTIQYLQHIKDKSEAPTTTKWPLKQLIGRQELRRRYDGIYIYISIDVSHLCLWIIMKKRSKKCYFILFQFLCTMKGQECWIQSKTPHHKKELKQWTKDHKSFKIEWNQTKSNDTIQEFDTFWSDITSDSEWLVVSIT